MQGSLTDSVKLAKLPCAPALGNHNYIVTVNPPEELRVAQGRVGGATEALAGIEKPVAPFGSRQWL